MAIQNDYIKKLEQVSKMTADEAKRLFLMKYNVSYPQKLQKDKTS